jgi:peptidyl-prolyl cis-trans isomerase SurA
MFMSYRKNKNHPVLFCLVAFFFTGSLFAQGNKIIDRVMAVVGNNIILQSDIEKQYQQAVAQGEQTENMKCQIFDQLLLQKLMINQAAIDSVTPTDSQIESEMDKRMRYYIKQIGSEQRLEEYFHTTIIQLKSELRDIIKEQLTVQSMQSKITKDITATPNDVREYFNSIPADSVPYIDAEMEVAQIVRKPPISAAEKKSVRTQMEEYRKSILDGSDFAVYAALYSQDNSTAKKGGELGFFERGAMVPEFEAAAFNLKPGEVSPVIETKFGFHLLQLIERRGDQINVRHILLQPKISEEDIQRCMLSLDTLRRKILMGTLTFEEAAEKNSDDEDSRYNGGLIINPETGTSKLSPDKMDRLLFFQVDTMKLNVVSEPLQMSTSEGSPAYRLVIVKSRTQPHRANLKDDYQKIQEVAQQEKQSKTLSDWVEKKRKSTYIQVNDDMNGCDILKHWKQVEN